MRYLTVRLALWMAVALATAAGVYAQVPGFASIAGLIALAVGGALLLETRRTADVVNRAGAERDALAEALHAEQEKVGELQRLLLLVETIGTSTDVDQLQRAIHEALSPILRTREIWLTARVGGWHEVFRDPRDGPAAAKSRRGWEAFPLRVGEKAIGVLGVAQGHGPFTPDERRFVTYASSIIAIALKNAQLFQAIKEHSVTDVLTGCATRSHGLDLLARELRRSARAGTTVSILMIDADHFKAINDRYGHPCGDAALRHIGRVLKLSVRATDLPSRYGGEEFLVILPDTSANGAAKVAESIRQAIAQPGLTCGAAAVRLTVSCGVATAVAGEAEPAALIARADAALYGAKSSGRNRVHVYGEHRQDTRAPRLEPPSTFGERREARPDRRQRRWGRRSTDTRETAH